MILGIVASVFSYTMVYDIAIGVVGVQLLLFIVYSKKKASRMQPEVSHEQRQDQGNRHSAL